MIDWGNLAASAFWISGCSLVLASLSYANWLASQHGEKRIAALKSSGAWISLHIGAILFCAGLASGSSSWVERIVWVSLGVAILLHLVTEKPSSR